MSDNITPPFMSGIVQQQEQEQEQEQHQYQYQQQLLTPPLDMSLLNSPLDLGEDFDVPSNSTSDFNSPISAWSPQDATFAPQPLYMAAQAPAVAAAAAPEQMLVEAGPPRAARRANIGPMSKEHELPALKKPGRKPMPPTESQDRRRTQNRESQRSYRDRRNRKVSDLNDEISDLRNKEKGLRAHIHRMQQEHHVRLQKLQQESAVVTQRLQHENAILRQQIGGGAVQIGAEQQPGVAYPMVSNPYPVGWTQPQQQQPLQQPQPPYFNNPFDQDGPAGGM